MKLYHVTTIERAATIRRGGFRDSNRDGLIGVWFSDQPLWDGGHIDGAPDGWVILVIDAQSIPLGDFFVACPERPYKEWCIPAKVINKLPIMEQRQSRNDPRADRRSGKSRPPVCW